MSAHAVFATSGDINLRIPSNGANECWRIACYCVLANIPGLAESLAGVAVSKEGTPRDLAEAYADMYTTVRDMTLHFAPKKQPRGFGAFESACYYMQKLVKALSHNGVAEIAMISVDADLTISDRRATDAPAFAVLEPPPSFNLSGPERRAFAGVIEPDAVGCVIYRASHFFALVKDGESDQWRRADSLSPTQCDSMGNTLCDAFFRSGGEYISLICIQSSALSKIEKRPAKKTFVMAEDLDAKGFLTRRELDGELEKRGLLDRRALWFPHFHYDAKALRERVSALEEAAKERSRALARISSEVQEKGQAIVRATSEVEALKQDSRERVALVEAFRAQAEELRKQAEELKRQREELRKQSEELRNQAAELKRQREDMKKQEEMLKREAEERMREGVEMRNSVGLLRREVREASQAPSRKRARQEEGVEGVFAKVYRALVGGQ